MHDSNTLLHPPEPRPAIHPAKALQRHDDRAVSWPLVSSRLFDRFTGGGHAPGKVYGLLGPIGGCKSTICYQLAVDFIADIPPLTFNDQSVPLVFVVSYSDSEQMMQTRLLCRAAVVHRDRLQESTDHDRDLSGPDDPPVDYELAMFGNLLNAGVHVPCERERIDLAAARLNRHLVFLPFHDSRGTGYIPEIAQRIQAKLQERPNSRCAMVIIDDVAPMVYRHLAYLRGEYSQLPDLIGSAPTIARDAIAARFGCPVWLAHQVRPAANRLTQGAAGQYTDAAENWMFGVNTDFCVVIGKPRQGDNLFVIDREMYPRTESQSRYAVAELVGGIGLVRDRSRRYTADPHTGEILSIAEHARQFGRRSSGDRRPAVRSFDRVGHRLQREG
jgi:hypothetical protein